MINTRGEWNHAAVIPHVRPHSLHFSTRYFSPALCLAVALSVSPFSHAHGAAPERLAALAVSLEKSPDSAALLVEQADLMVEHGDHAVARRSLDRAEAMGRKDLPIERVRARLLIDEGKLVEAVAHLDKAVAASLADTAALMLRAKAYQSLGKRDESLADYRAVADGLTAPTGDFAIEAADAFVSAGQLEEAGRILKKAVNVSGKAPSLLARLIDIDVALGRPAAAIEWVDAMQQRAPRAEPWMARRAELLAQAGKTDEARVAWTALRDHLAKLPSLERGSPALRPLAERVAKALATLPPPRSTS